MDFIQCIAESIGLIVNFLRNSSKFKDSARNLFNSSADGFFFDGCPGSSRGISDCILRNFVPPGVALVSGFSGVFVVSVTFFP